MSLLPVLDLGLAVLVLAVAGWTIAARELFSSVVGYVAYGLLLAIVWVRLYAPDVALTEAAIGSGVTGVLLVTSGARLRRAGEGEAMTPGLSQRVLARPRSRSWWRRRLRPWSSCFPSRRRRLRPRRARGSPRPVSAIRSPRS